MMQEVDSDCAKQLALVYQDFEEFVYIVSHDLKAPVRAISNLVDWIDEDLGSEVGDDIKGNLKLLKSRTTRLERMIGAILQISRITRRDLDIKSIDLVDFLGEMVTPFLSDKVEITFPQSLPTITTYYKKLQQVLEQLISNAISFSDKDKVEINITTEETSDFILFEVQDNGPGIAPSNAGKIFTMFYTGRSKDIDEAIGAGLTVAKKTTEFVGGDLQLKEEGAGCTFLIKWPKNLNQNT